MYKRTLNLAQLSHLLGSQKYEFLVMLAGCALYSAEVDFKLLIQSVRVM